MARQAQKGVEVGDVIDIHVAVSTLFAFLAIVPIAALVAGGVFIQILNRFESWSEKWRRKVVLGAAVATFFGLTWALGAWARLW